MGVYINMEMPKDGDLIVIRPDGKAYYVSANPQNAYEGEAVLVPPHGDLIDLKAPFNAQYYDEMTEEWLEKIVTVEDALYGCMVDEMPPTVIPASEDG